MQFLQLQSFANNVLANHNKARFHSDKIVV